MLKNTHRDFRVMTQGLFPLESRVKTTVQSLINQNLSRGFTVIFPVRRIPFDSISDF